MPLPPAPKMKPLRKPATDFVARMGDLAPNPAQVMNRLTDTFFGYLDEQVRGENITTDVADNAKALFNIQMFKQPAAMWSGGEYSGSATPEKAAQPQSRSPSPERIMCPESVEQVSDRFDNAKVKILEMISHREKVGKYPLEHEKKSRPITSHEAGIVKTALEKCEVVLEQALSVVQVPSR